ncbi:MAG: hypothetical protein ABIO99_07695 [Candidatus Limnocylindria bacterium]
MLHSPLTVHEPGLFARGSRARARRTLDADADPRRRYGGVLEWALAITLGNDLSLEAADLGFEVPILLSAIGLVLLIIGFASGRNASSAGRG